MYIYTLGQWLLFFFCYSFCGWIWECCYVSARKRQWVNRGFLRGPLLPIYGTGAVIILLAVIPVREDPALVFLLGMLAATALEYVTGAAMEALFKVRYWDYSKQPCNLHGYICLTSSLAWGFFSVLLVRFLHPPVEDLILALPGFLTDALACVLTVVTTADAVRSFQAAMDLREVLTRLTEENEDLRRLARRVEVYSAFAEDDLRKFRERTEVERLLRQERLDAARRQLREDLDRRARRRRDRWEDGLRRRTAAKLSALSSIREALEDYQARLESATDLAGEALETRRAETEKLLERIRDREAAIRTRTADRYRQAMRLLGANPSASAARFSEALDSLRTQPPPPPAPAPPASLWPHVSAGGAAVPSCGSWGKRRMRRITRA